MTTEAELHDQRITLENRVLAARTRLEHKLHELGRRVETTKEALDLARIVREHPAAAAGIAMAAGALFGFMTSGRSKMGTAVGTLITGAAMQVARGWIAARVGEVLDDRTP